MLTFRTKNESNLYSTRALIVFIKIEKVRKMFSIMTSIRNMIVVKHFMSSYGN